MQVIKVEPQLHGTDPIIKHYQEMMTSRSQILENIPKFNEYLILIENEFNVPIRNMARIESLSNDALVVRKTLDLMFDHFEAASMAIDQLAQLNNSQRDMIIANISYSSNQFIKLNRFTLKMLPGKLPSFTEEQTSSSVNIPTHGSSGRPSLVSSISNIFTFQIKPLVEEKEIFAPLPANFGALMQKLEVLHEQRAHLEAQLESARVKRRYADLAALHTAIEEINQEISRLKLMCSK